MVTLSVDQVLDMTVHQALALERPIQPFPSREEGITDFQTKEGRTKRRALSKDFWQN